MRARTAAKAASVLALGSALALTLSGAAFAASGPTNLTGKGCPSSYSNSADGGTYVQALTKKFVAANGLQYGDYSVIFRNAAGGKSTLPSREYRCY
ncbi:hypothetical protein HUT16_02930 [Kitasatospora sp. NA04385]|uniref:hypothetical protein n=1 Tax=Kitasatospora sp. NA04385 TaxID=2742135 RepID=UPI0015915612|nr:hypothetical protein [Kitasatospora sp. NA04385]QKW18155.1 hypothetical protein HUT16_02930 [Kitasatospora sp. NA04385]